MSNFNYYLNRQGTRGRQGAKGEKGDTGYSPYIDIKSNTPTEFIMTIHNESESFDTPNLIPTAIGEKVTEMDAVLTTHTEDIANLKLDITAIKNKDNAQDSDIAALKTRVGGTEESIEDLNHKYTVIGSEVSDLTLTKQNKLVEGANITLTDNADGTTTISASGGGGGGGSDVPIATTQVAGKVKPDGETITVTSDGTISSVSKDVTPIATTSSVGKVKPDGTTITITDDGTISSVGGGGGTPENMMTIDTNQTVSGVKTFTNRVDIGISGLESRITTTNNSESGQRQDLSIVSSGDLALSTGNVAFTDDDGGSHVRQGKIIDGSGNVVLTQGNVTAGNNITITKTSKGIQIASSGGGGEAPANMVTLDTNQVITGEKGFYSPIKLVSSSTDNYYGQIVRTSGDAIKIQAQYGNPAGLNITTSSLTYTDASGIDHNLLSSGSGDAPANMVTTDTNQDITGVKRFLNNRQNLSQPAIKIGSYAAGQDNYDGGYITTGIGNLEIGDYYATNSKGGFLSITSTADSSIFKITSSNTNINPRLQLGTYNYEGEIYNDIAEGLCLSNHKYDYSYPRSILKIKDDTLTFKKTDGTVVDLLAGGGAAIDDSAASNTSTYSSSKIEKLTNITSSDTSISVTKSDTGVDIVANKDLVTSYAFPSNKYVDLKLGASNSSYTMPANGYIYIGGLSNGADGRIEVFTGRIGTKCVNPISKNSLKCFIPVVKSDVAQLAYANVDISVFRFVYAVGSESEAQ